MAAAQQMPANDVFISAPQNSADPLRPGFFHYPEDRYFEVRLKKPDGARVSQRFKYNEESPSYENNVQAREAAQAFIYNLRNLSPIPRPE